MDDSRKQEIELRAKVNSGILAKLKGIPVCEADEQDTYYSYKPDKKRSWIIRIRKRNKDEYLLTFKSKKYFGEGVWSEVEIKIDQEKALQMRDFLLTNHFFMDVKISKHRKTYVINNMEVNVDRVRELGTYIEAEIMSNLTGVDMARETIKSFLLSLGIKAIAITDQGYVSILRNKYGTAN